MRNYDKMYFPTESLKKASGNTNSRWSEEDHTSLHSSTGHWVCLKVIFKTLPYLLIFWFFPVPNLAFHLRA